MASRFTTLTALLLLTLAPGFAQKKNTKAAPPAAATPAPQKMDEEYTKLIQEYLQDSRVTTELVDHMPASDTVPSPLKFFGRIPGTPGELTYAKDINRYYEALAQASPRAKFWKIGKSEEGRDRWCWPSPTKPPSRISTSTKTCWRAGRSAQDHRGAGAAVDQYRQADLLDHQRHPFARDRRPGNADRARLPADRRRDAVHSDDPQQRDFHHAGDRSGRPREARSTRITTARRPANSGRR